MTATDTDYDAVVDQIRRWPAARRFTLIHDVLQTLAAERGAEQEQGPLQPRVSTLSHAIGLLKGEGAPPSDEQIRQLLEERRLERFG